MSAEEGTAPELTAEEQAAVDHVREIIEQNEMPHSTTSCPPFTRAMCRHGAVIKRLQAERRWPL